MAFSLRENCPPPIFALSIAPAVTCLRARAGVLTSTRFACRLKIYSGGDRKPADSLQKQEAWPGRHTPLPPPPRAGEGRRGKYSIALRSRLDAGPGARAQA